MAGRRHPVCGGGDPVAARANRCGRLVYGRPRAARFWPASRPGRTVSQGFGRRVAITDRPSGRRRRRGWAFIDLAALGRNTVWSYVATVIAIVLAVVGFVIIAFVAAVSAMALHLTSGPPTLVQVLTAAFLSEIAVGVALAWRVARGHRRPWLSLISTDLRLDWRRFAIGAGVEGGLLLLFVAIGRLATGEPVALGSGIGLPALLLILALVPFQAASEEMLFRGYLTQALGRVMRSRVAIAAVVGVAFGVLHGGVYGFLTMPYLFALSVIYSIVSLRDERLELTIGAHTATNWFGAPNALAIAHGAVQLTWGTLPVLLLNGALFYAITRFLVARLCGEKGD